MEAIPEVMRIRDRDSCTSHSLPQQWLFAFCMIGVCVGVIIVAFSYSQLMWPSSTSVERCKVLAQTLEMQPTYTHLCLVVILVSLVSRVHPHFSSKNAWTIGHLNCISPRTVITPFMTSIGGGCSKTIKGTGTGFIYHWNSDIPVNSLRIFPDCCCYCALASREAWSDVCADFESRWQGP